MEFKRIAFLIYNLGSGGAERVVSSLANSLVDHYKVTIITLVKTEPFYTLRPEIDLLHCRDEIKTVTNPISSVYDGLVRIKTIYKLLKKNRIELLIGFMTTANIYAIWASKLAKIPCIISERANHEIYKLPKSIIKIRDFSYPHTNLLVVQTEGNKKFYENVIASSKIVVIQNPISPSLQSERELPRKEVDKKIILNVGSFKSGKAQDLLISAFANIPNDDWELILVGDGPNKKKFMQLADDLNISEKTSFEGKRTDIHNYYKKASIFVFTSEHEGFPNALMEALFFGVPSISTNCPHGPADLIQDKKNGYLVPVGDQVLLEEKMKRLMSQADLRTKFSQNSIKSTEKLKMATISEIWKKHIDQLL
ncbi:glycosyltransferase family 4 protein [Zobellia uliginosa]|uniref:glycosyltransferase family 4 protein n=1 Tax=Zobellia uliginosa TaxID=143224 RepID=UPI0026E14BBD|nr:glycosyltransferase family 4 protein [Zobellia uliginosa]MDO6518277.1 glycosyltransferase family 4 protein [Zobellia uliginosa]